MKPGFYKITGIGSESIMDKVEKSCGLWTKSGRDSRDNNFKKGPILANVEIIRGGKAYVLLATEVYTIPWPVVISVKELSKFTLTPIDEKLKTVTEPRALPGWRGHNFLIDFLENNR